MHDNTVNYNVLPSFQLYTFKSQSNVSSSIADVFYQKLHLRSVSVENMSMPSIDFNISSRLNFGKLTETYSKNRGLNLLILGTMLGGEQVDIKPFTIFIKSLRKVNREVEVVIIMEAPLLKDAVELGMSTYNY